MQLILFQREIHVISLQKKKILKLVPSVLPKRTSRVFVTVLTHDKVYHIINSNLFKYLEVKCSAKFRSTNYSIANQALADRMALTSIPKAVINITLN